MSHIFGEIRQIGFIADDVDMAMDYWANVSGSSLSLNRCNQSLKTIYTWK
jgi:hypothetical protein